ncbi:hypothetical protein F2Q69_00048454 [Brassica cretica]|uniref:Uncharacterized protein n=1 Tax=Brassica cretica TaxID=69181 RepID=A0A8S9Q4G9_BRACR|nr:hypothetical protein F2Q69_00048454 [Brassica cretica]
MWKHGNDDYRPTFSAARTWDQIRVKRSKVEWSRVVWFPQGVPRFSFITCAKWRYYLRPRGKEPPVREVLKKERKRLPAFAGNWTEKNLSEYSSELTIRGRYEEDTIERCTFSVVDRYRRDASTIED